MDKIISFTVTKSKEHWKGYIGSFMMWLYSVYLLVPRLFASFLLL